ncbi:gliding motility protein GldN [Aquimarina sp. MMG015]|uniref:type IX secretion system ring protein PorN/GldN n=1 Tax=Aquimarina TaxID=290174 RepID=UPI0004829859|nr:MULTISPECIES: gliding motility protein GldN [Aquimarina]AXT56803.1 gliding motility protein GldN [Aquimarina sp. AD1]MBQ4802803.1 gliding motility protein GldN [Aquimarina sp. MMG015]RKN31957.1 gliding motility protein GldN [Aquimarina sp. AD1]
MNLKNLLLTVFGLFVTLFSFGQANILNADSPEDIGKKTIEQIQADNDLPLEYGYVDKRDVLWAKTTWETIDLDERINFPLYYPIDTVNIGADRRALYDVLLSNVKNGKIQKIYADSYFTETRTLSDLDGTLSKIDTLDLGYEQFNAGEPVDPQYIEVTTISAADISEYKIRGYWYFDKRQGELRYRLLGIAPVAPDVNFINDDEPDMVPLFWVWYPDVREILHNAKAFNRKNTSMPFTYDHVLNARRFNSVIYKEDNIQGDREVNDYIIDNALMQLLESERIKESIRNFEMDMWSY